jgi:hypothetical protein
MKQFTMKAMGLLAMLLAFGWVQAQNSEPVTPKADPLSELNASPAGYDAAKTDWVATHPKEYDALNGVTAKAAGDQAKPWGAEANKEAWITAHPREYAEMVAVPADSRIRMSKAEFNAFPVEKQAAIKNDTKFIIED